MLGINAGVPLPKTREAMRGCTPFQRFPDTFPRQSASRIASISLINIFFGVGGGGGRNGRVGPALISNTQPPLRAFFRPLRDTY